MASDQYYYERLAAKDPKWDEALRVHGWRNYISEKVRSLWDTFTPEQRAALIESADDNASREEWE